MNKKIRTFTYILFVSFLLLAGCGKTPAVISPAAPTGTTAVNTPEPSPYPQILKQNPQPGEKLGLLSPVVITFDRPMQPDKTASAFTLIDSSGRPIPGKVTWTDPQTMSFKADEGFQPAADLLAGFTTSAVSADGKSIPQAISLKFTTTDELSVGQVFPFDQAVDVDYKTAVTVIFNKPVIPLMTKEEQAKLPSPLIITPEVKGQGNWVSSSVYVFQPENGLKSGTGYSVSVKPGLQDVTGSTLSSQFNWSFSTRSPLVSDFALKDVGQGYTDPVENVLLDQGFQVTFSQAMDQKITNAAVSMRNKDTKLSVPLTLTWDKQSKVLTVQPARRLSIASLYSFNVSASAAAQDGGTFASPYEISLSTVSLPAVINTYPALSAVQTAYSSMASVFFNTPMQASSMQNHVKVVPEPQVPVKVYYRDGQNQLDIAGFEPSTQYVVTLQPGLSDIYGNTIKSPYTFSFKTAAITPQGRLLAPYYPMIYRQKSDQSIYLEYSNLEYADLSLYKLDFTSFTDLESGNLAMENLPASSGTLIRNWRPKLLAQKNTFARILLKFDESKPLQPGLYYLGLKARPVNTTNRFLQGVVFIVSDDNLALKVTQDEALAWLVKSDTGTPVPNAPVVFYNESWQEVGRANTDANGVAFLPDVKKVQYVQSVDPAHLSFTAINWGSGVNEGMNGIWTDYWSPAKNTFAYTYTERPLYRPNQPVYIKGIVRANDDLHYTLPSLTQIYVMIENEQGKVFSDYVQLAKDGTFGMEYQLSVDAPVGNYSITLREKAGDDMYLSWSDFRVAEYVKPEFQVNTTVDKEIILNGDTAVFSLDASYYSGGSLSNADVSWFTEMHQYNYTPPEAYNNYSFSDYDYTDYYNNGGSMVPPVFKDGTGTTDTKGHFELQQKMDLPKAGVSQQVTFSANVTDVGGSLVGSSTNLNVLASAVHAGISPQDYVANVDDPKVFNLVVLDIDGKPVANRAVTVDFAEQQWFSVVRKDENGVSRWETTVKSIPAGSASAVTGSDGLASVSFTPKKGGQFKATITALDDKNRPSKASASIWVSGTDYVAWQQNNDRSFQLIADKASYNPGDTAKILIAQPFKGENYALITTERGHIYEKKVVKLLNNSTVYEIPITSDMAPVMYVSAMVVKAADGKTPPDFKMGIVRININPSMQKIFVSLAADKSTAGPGEKVTYTLTTKDLNGKPVQADVSLALVDKAVLALVPSNTQSLLDTFYWPKGLSVLSASSIVVNAEDFNANYQETSPTGEHAGGGGGGKGEGDTGIVTVRQNFKDTAFWQAQVMTDANGTAQVMVTLPDNLTTWQMKARAVTEDTRVGETESEILSTRPLQVQLQTPRFFVVDDSVTLGAVVHNNTDKPLDVKVSLQVQGLTLSSPAEQTINVLAGQQAYATWIGQVSHNATRVDMVASASSGAYSDATRPALGTLPGQGLPVLTFHVTETVGSANYLRDAGTITEGIALPGKLNQDYLGGTLNLDVSPSLAASMTDGLTYLDDYPYLCMEQTVSRFLPNLISLEALKLAGKPTDALQKSLDEQIQPALQRIFRNQNSDGGWGLWPGSQSQLNTTAYVVIGLSEAGKAGYTIPEYMLGQALDYLSANISSSFTGNYNYQNNQAAIALYALSLGSRSDAIRMSDLFADRDKLDLYGKAFLMQAMQLTDPADERIQSLLSDLDSAAAKSASGAWWNETEADYWNWNTDIRTTAIILNALLQVDPQNVLIPNGIHWLMAHREGDHWYSTQETAWSLMALTHWLSLSGEFQTNYQYTIKLNGDVLKTAQADAAHLSQTTSLHIDAQQLLADRLNTLDVTRGPGAGVLYYTAYMDYSLPVKDIPALDQGIMVSQQYFSPTDLKTPITAANRGDLVQVRLTLVVPHSLHYLVVDDPLPAGLEAVDASLATSQEVPSAYQPQDYDRYGWGWWYFYYKQIYDDKVVMSADYLPAGTYTINYLARAATAGQFHVLPVTARQFYFPDVSGRSAGSQFTVNP